MFAWFKGLRFQLLLLSAVPLALCIVISVLAVTFMRGQSQVLEKTGLLRIPFTQYSGDMTTNLNSMVSHVWKLGAAQSGSREQTLADLNQALTKFTHARDEYLKLPRPAYAVEAWKTFDTNWPKVETAIYRVRSLANSGGRDTEIIRLLEKELSPAVQPIEAMFASLDSRRTEDNSRDVTVELDRSQQLTSWLAWLAVLGGVGVLGFSLYLGIRITKSLAKISAQVSQSSTVVHSTAVALAGASQQLAASSQEQASAVEEVSSSLVEISGMVASTLKGTENSVKLARDIERLIGESTEAMTELRTSMDEITASNKKVEELAKLIEEIGEKTDLIDEIVFQTRLLSFNASVEAERAGEHGRGFAVVAQEVGNLAQMSGKSANEITQIVKASIKEASEVATTNRSKVDSGVHSCKKTATKLDEIRKASQTILESAEQVLRGSEEQNLGINQINQSIQQISQTTQENAASAEETSSGSSLLTSQGEQLKKEVGELEQLIHGDTDTEDAPVLQTPLKPIAAARTPAAPVIPLNSRKQGQPEPSVQPGEHLRVANGSSNDPWEKL